MTCMDIINSQLEVCEIILSINSTDSLFSEVFKKTFHKYHLSIEIDIDKSITYAHKSGLEDPFFRRLKLIV